MGLVLVKLKALLLPSPLCNSDKQEKKNYICFLEGNEAGQMTS